ncbi:RNA-directed DNA polymerase, eukaryota, reverse transcriptase zinc-binding domain protein [Tanacetum coccineum]
MFDDKVNNMDSIVGLDEGRDSGKSSGNRENDVSGELVEKVNDQEIMENQAKESNLGDEIGNNKDKECLDVENDMSDENSNMKECPNGTNDSGMNDKEQEENTNGSTNDSRAKTYANMVTKDVKYANNKLNFILTKVTKERCKVVIFDEDLVDKGKGISALASSLGRPIIKDNMTAKRCKLGEGRMDFARVLGSKHVSVEYAWKPESCSHCNVFGHSHTNCEKRERSAEEIMNKEKKKEEIANQRNKRNGELNNSSNFMWNRRFGDQRQVKGGRFYNARTKDNENRRNKGEAWKKKGINKGKVNGQKANDKENSRNKAKDGEGILMGDFNVTLKMEEHSAGGSKINRDMQDFRDCVNDIEMEDINSSGLFFTWIKSPSKPDTSIFKKLNRAMVNSEFLDKYRDAHARFLPFLISDHSPVVLHIPNSLDKKKKSFRFSNFVADKPDFLDVVKKEWKCDCEGYSMHKLVKKMKRMKIPLHNIAWKNGNLFQNVKKLEEKLKMAQVKVEANPNCRKVKEKLSQVLQDYNIAINDEEKLLAQKAKVKWLSEGDKNTKYFHNVIKSRINSNIIRGICDEQGNWFEGEKVAEQFVKHFEKFLSNNGGVEEIESLNDLFINKISQDNADSMVMDITNKEIKEAIFGIGNDKAPRPDGFIAIFFKRSWDIMGEDVCTAVKEFFKSNKLLGEVNATLITLVPKVQHPNKVSDFRPIACCNVLYKCISKIITNRIQGCLEDLGKESFNLSPSISSKINHHSRWIKLGELWDCQLGNLTAGVSIVEGEESNCDYKSMEVIKDGLMEFSKTSGLVPNMSKSTIFFGSVKEIDKKRIFEIMPFAVGKLPMKYLGVPLITKNIGTVECNQLVERVKQKVNDWKNKGLSYAGRLQMIASVLASMHIYWASIFLIPKTTVKDIEKVLKGFLWSQGDLKRGAAKIAWKIVCTPKNKGRLGIKRLGPWNEALLCKHLWNVSSKKESLGKMGTYGQTERKKHLGGGH